jgi:hypothetical protein
VKKSPFLIIISTFRGGGSDPDPGSGSGEKFPDPDPAKRSGSDRIRITNTGRYNMILQLRLYKVVMIDLQGKIRAGTPFFIIITIKNGVHKNLGLPIYGYGLYNLYSTVPVYW